MEQYEKQLFEFWENVKTGNAAADIYNPDSSGWKKESHIPYLGDYDPWHVLNLYYPRDYDGSHKLKTVIYIHGGGWLYGTVDLSERYLGWIASQGYAVMGMSYRLLQYTDLKGLIRDIYGAMRWLKKYGPARGFDLDNVLITGDSAGGHLTDLTACIENSEKLQKAYGVKPVKFNIKALCVSCPCADTNGLYINGEKGTKEGEGTAAAYKSLMLGKAGENAAWYGLMGIDETIAALDTKPADMPPLFIIGSETESLYHQTCFLKKQLDKSRWPYEEIIWKKKEGPHLQHVFNISHWEWRESLISNKKMLEFFERKCSE